MRKAAICVGICFITFLVIPLGCLAQEDTVAEQGLLVEQVTVVDEMIGYIDWEEGYIYAVGDGVPPAEAVNPAQARVMAKRAAIDTALARLLEMAKAVRVDAESTTVNFVNESYVVRTRVSGLVANAEIVKLRHFEDGSYQILMRMPINGIEGLASAILPIQIEKVIHVRIAYEITAEEMQEEMKAAYTGLIVDARGLEVKPAMYPRLVTQAGKVIYDIMAANPNIVIQQGLVDYCSSLEAAMRCPRIGENPLTVEAIAVSGTYGADLVLSEEDAEKILQADASGHFLSEARVVIVIGSE